MMFLGLRKLGNISCGHKMFLNKIRNIFVCVPDTKFVSATNVARAGKRGNICVGNNVFATMCPRLQVLKDQLRSWNIEKTDFPKLCQNKGLGELVLKIQVSGRLDFYISFGNFFFCILRSQRPKLTPKLGIFWKLPFKK